jgi:hypothetical protein
VAEAEIALERELPRRLVLIGDLNGHGGLFLKMLRGLRLVGKDGHWCGGKTVLVQMGDVLNRGPSPRVAMDLLMTLEPEAREAGGDVLWLLGNHEVLSVLGHEAYVTAEEYLEFATETELETYFKERTLFQYQFLGEHRADGRVPPMTGLLKAWEEEHAPGKAEYRRAMGPSGRFGKMIRRLPIAVRFGHLLLVHGGLSPRWAEQGLAEIGRAATRAWDQKPESYEALDPHSVLRDPLGPLWHRFYCLASAERVQSDLREALRLVGATQMIVGHTRTDASPGGFAGKPHVRHKKRLIMTDVGLGDPGEPGCVLVIERGKIEAWSPGGAKGWIADVKTPS